MRILILLLAILMPLAGFAQVEVKDSSINKTELINGLECLKQYLDANEEGRQSNEVNRVLVKELYRKVQQGTTPELLEMIKVSLYEPAKEICGSENLAGYDAVFTKAIKTCYCDD